MNVYTLAVFILSTFVPTLAYADGVTSAEAGAIRVAESTMPLWKWIFVVLFTPRYFEPHWVHFADDPLLLWVTVVANVWIFVAYTLIPIALIYFIWKRRELLFSSVFWLFGAFIVLCGLHHIVHVVTFWYPIYYFQALIDMLTALVSMVTFFVLIPILPKAIRLESPGKIFELNEKLEREVMHRSAKLEQLEQNEKTLTQSLDESKRMNKLMVNRELRMRDMKEEVNELLIELGRPKKYSLNDTEQAD